MQGAFAFPGPTHSKMLIEGLEVKALWTNRSPGVQMLFNGSGFGLHPSPNDPPSETLPTVCEPLKPHPFGFPHVVTPLFVTVPAPATVTLLWKNHSPMFVSPLFANRVPPK